MGKLHQVIGVAAFVCAIVITLILVNLESAPEISYDGNVNHYSIENVLRHIENIGKVSRAVGTENHQNTIKYLEKNLSDLGVAPELQTAWAVNSRWGTPYRGGYVSNITGRIKGSGNGDTILMVAHYDSVPTSPGAADNASSVASILETLRVLKNDPQGENDVVVLFSDAEEIGMLGARAFVNETPWLDNIKAVINLEARGSSGASLLFETTAGNSELVKSYANAVSHPIASSFFSDIYKILPNDTDFTEFKFKNINGLNTAFIEQVNNYHTQADNLENLDKNSVGQQGENLLATVRELRNRNFSESSSEELVFFDLFGKKLIYYPLGLVIPLMIAAIVLYATAIYFGFKAGKLTFKGIISGFFLFVLFLFSELLLSFIVLKIIAVFHKDYSMFLSGDTYNSGYYSFGIMCLVTALAFVFYGFFGKTRKPENLLFGSLGFWILLTVLTSLVLPGTSYIFSLSSISVLIASLIAFLWKGKNSSDVRNFSISLLGSVTGIILIGGILRHLIKGLGIGLIPVGVFFVALEIGLLIYIILLFDRKIRILISCLLGLGGIILIVGGLASVKYSPQQPRQTSLFWAMDSDTKKAFWATEDINLNEWNEKIFEGNSADTLLPEIFPQSQRFFLAKETQPLDLPQSSLEKTADEVNGNIRRIKLKINSPNQAPVITLAIESETEVSGFEIDGKDFSGEIAGANTQKNSWAIRLYGVPANGAEITLNVNSGEPLKIRMITQNYGLPPASGVSLASRPADLIASPQPFNDSTFITKLFIF